jgi:hypothetical protein
LIPSQLSVEGIAAVIECMSLKPTPEQRAVDSSDVDVMMIMLPDSGETKAIHEFIAAGGLDSQLTQVDQPTTATRIAKQGCKPNLF